MEEIRIAILGHRFMGRAHSNAWLQAPRFFDLPYKPVLQVACGRDTDSLQAFADRWGWAEIETDWRKLLERDDIDAIDIALPTHLHAETAIAAAEAGKHIFCEKPFCNSTAEAEAILAAAEKAGVVHYLNHNYRRCPAVAFAHQLVKRGKLGRIYHVRAQYLQDWGGPETPLLWRFVGKEAGSGAHGDLNATSWTWLAS